MAAVIIGAALVTIALGASACARWIYQRGQQSGINQTRLEAERSANAEALADAQVKVKALEGQLTDAQAKVKALEGRVAEIQTEVEFIRKSHPVALCFMAYMSLTGYTFAR